MDFTCVFFLDLFIAFTPTHFRRHPPLMVAGKIINKSIKIQPNKNKDPKKHKAESTVIGEWLKVCLYSSFFT